MINMDQLNLSDFFQSKSQAQDFSLRLGAIAEKIYETSFNLENALLEQFGIKKKEKFITFLRDNNVTPENVSALKAIISKIQEQISALPVITLTLAINPNGDIIKALSDWFLLNLKKQILFDIHVDSHLIGGAILTYGGKYLDASLKPIFDEIMKNEITQEAQGAITVDYGKYNATPLNMNHTIVPNA